MPITTAKEIIFLKMPSLAGPPEDTRIDDFVELAKFSIAESVFKAKYQYALALVVCHQLTLDAQGGGSDSQSGSGVVGGINEEKEGQLMRKYGAGSGASISISENKAYYMSTPFGQELLNLFNICIISVRNRFV